MNKLLFAAICSMAMLAGCQQAEEIVNPGEELPMSIEASIGKSDVVTGRYAGETPNNVSFKNDDAIGLLVNNSNFTQWTGERPLTQKEKNEVTAIIGKMKKLNKPIRFWASPDTPLAWETLHKLGVDFIGTDMPNAACLFFEKDRK